MSASHPSTATNNIRFDPTYLDAISRRKNELPVALCGASRAKVQLKPDTGPLLKDHPQLVANTICQDELLGADGWVLVEAKAQAKDDLADGRQSLRHTPRP